MLFMVTAVAMLSKNPDDALICCFSDPLPPTNLEVQTESTRQCESDLVLRQHQVIL